MRCSQGVFLFVLEMSSNKSDFLTIPEYYAGKKRFLTGATGFIGKVCIEKLLRCCPDVAGIYCLIRPKKGRDVKERVEKLCEDKVSFYTVKSSLTG